MKLAAIIIAVLGMVAGGWAQSTDKPAGQSAPAGQAASAAAPQGKRPPQAKTQPEFDAYKAVVGLTDPVAKEKAADDFAARFPDSELRSLVYKSVLQSYQQANNAEKMLDMAARFSLMTRTIQKPCWASLRCWRSGRATRIWTRISGWPTPGRMLNAL